MKILFVASDVIPHIGGKSTHIIDLKDGMCKNGNNVDIISLKSLGRKNEIFIKILISPLKFLNSDAFNYCFKILWGKILNKKVKKYCKINKPDFISVQDAFAASSISNAIKELNVTTILTMHTYFGLESSLDKKVNRLSKKIYDSNLNYEMKALDVVNGVIAVDDRIKEHVNTHIQHRINTRLDYTKVKSIENFTNIDLYTIANKDEKYKYRKEFNISNNDIVISCARRLVEKNGVINAVKAIKCLKDYKDYNVVLLIAGDGPQKDEINKFISKNNLQNNVKLLGGVNSTEIRKVYVVSDISLVPSVTVNGLQEATSISAIEAMSCGIVTIASNIGGLKQLIKDKSNGVLVEEGDYKQIANEIIKIINDNEYKSKISINARKYIIENNSHIEAAKKYLSTFIELK